MWTRACRNTRRRFVGFAAAVLTRNFQTDDRGLTFRIRDAQSAVFAEDTQILEEQQRNILVRPDRELRNLKIDAGGVHARRIIRRELERHAQGVQAASFT